MKNILIIGASSSSKSMNRTFAQYAGSQLADAHLTVLDLNDFEMPIFSEDREEIDGIPSFARYFVEKIEQNDGVILSLAEHNGSYTSAFKNITDWASRVKQKLWSEKPVLLLSTSPGPRGASSVMELAKSTLPHAGAKITASFSLPSFYDQFSNETGIISEPLNKSFRDALEHFSKAIAD